MDRNWTESCGRCSVTTVVDATGDGDEDGAESPARNPLDGERIEVDERELRSTVPHEFVARRVKNRLDDLATRFIYR